VEKSIQPPFNEKLKMKNEKVKKGGELNHDEVHLWWE